MPKKAVIFDFNRTLFDPVSGALYEGVNTMLEDQRNQRKMLLLSKREKGRDSLLRDLGIEGYFAAVYFVDEKTVDMVYGMLSGHLIPPGECIIIGDRARGELQLGHDAGIETIWVRQGIFADETPESYTPTHTVGSIEELRKLLNDIS